MLHPPEWHCSGYYRYLHLPTDRCRPGFHRYKLKLSTPQILDSYRRKLGYFLHLPIRLVCHPVASKLWPRVSARPQGFLTSISLGGDRTGGSLGLITVMSQSQKWPFTPLCYPKMGALHFFFRFRYASFGDGVVIVAPATSKTTQPSGKPALRLVIGLVTSAERCPDMVGLIRSAARRNAGYWGGLFVLS